MSSISKVKDRYQTTIPIEIREEAGIEVNSKLVWAYDDINGVILVMKKPESYTDYILGLGEKMWKEIGGAEFIKKERQEEKEYMENKKK